MYHDVDVAERTDILPTGKVMKVYHVSAYTRGDTYFSIRVAEKDFSKEKVDKLLTAKAELIEGVKSL